MTSETAISRWLRHEMPRRGYPLQGHRAGGISRLAQDSGIPQATMSRIVNGGAEPSIDSLRKLAALWNIPLAEILVHAGYAQRNELHTPTSPLPPSNVPAHVSLPDLQLWEQHIWRTPDLTVEQRELAILVIRLKRGDLRDDSRGLLRLYQALGKVVEHHLDNDNSHNGPRAV